MEMKKVIKYAIVFGLAFNIGVFTAYYKIDQRLWNENINKANDIETRALNYPMQDCYDWQDIEMIIFGEIQE
jgi:hypothetical protein